MTTIVYGVTPEGFVRKTEDAIISEMQSDELASIATDLDVSDEEIVGQFNGVIGRQIGICWEQLEVLYHGNDPDGSEGRLLEALCKLTGTFRRGLTKSQVVLQCALKTGATLVPGDSFAATEDRGDIRWTPALSVYPSNFVAEADGTYPVQFEAEYGGPVEGFAGTINVIATSVTGWTDCVNPQDAVLGIAVDDDTTLRQRREDELATIGSATVRAITANIAQAFSTQISNLTVYENEGDSIDANGLAPHSIETLIFDGDIPLVDNDALAQVILDSKAGGIQTSGNTTGNATGLLNGETSTIPQNFSRAVQLPIYIIVNLIKKPKVSYLGDAGVADFIATQANAYFGPGDEVVDERLRAFVMACTGVKDITSLFIGLTAGPTTSTNIPLTFRQIARFSSGRIVVNS